MRKDQNVGRYPGTDNVPFILRVDKINEAGDGFGQELEQVLDTKRKDKRYRDIVKSLRERGWQRPVTVNRHNYNGKFTIHDGHHRLAATIDLGMMHVLAVEPSDWGISDDSGVWHEYDPIPEYNYETGE